MSLWVVVFLTLFFSALFSGSEIAFVSSNKLKLELDRKRRIIPAILLSRIGRRPAHFIASLLLGNNIALVIYGLAMADLLDPVSGPFRHTWEVAAGAGVESDTLVLVVQTVISTVIILILAEFLPKTIFRINPNKTINTLTWALWPLYHILILPTYLFIGLSEWILRLIFRTANRSDEYRFSSGDVGEYLSEYDPGESADEDITQEVQMFQNVIDFRNIKLRECMIPRTEIIAVDKDEDVQTLENLFIETGLSRILVYEDTIDHIIGYVLSRDMFDQPNTILQHLKPVLIVPETMLASNLLTSFSEQNYNVAVVVDEFGGTSGMVTPEDVMEEIFGEIHDEFDTEDLTEKRLGDNEYLFAARLEIDYLNDKYDLGLPESEDYETLAGFILHHLEDIPQRDDVVEIQQFSFRITEAAATHIEQVELQVTGPAVR